MASSSSSQGSQPKIIEQIVEAGKKAFDPNLDTASRAAGVENYNRVIEEAETWALLPALNALIKPGILPAWLRDPVLQTLTRLPLRPGGVRATMEFVFSVHPSNNGDSAANADGPQKQGASITHEAVAVATRLLSSVPAGMTADEWFHGISDQLLELMDGEAGLEVARTAAQVVGYGILGRKQYGAPGTAGFNAFVQPLFEVINPSLRRKGDNKTLVKEEDDEIIDLGKHRVIIHAGPLKISMQRLSVLVLSNPSPGLCKRLVSPVLLQLWALASWPNPIPATEQNYTSAARDLLKAYLRLFGSSETVTPLIQNLLCKGAPETAENPWVYRLTANGEVEVVERRPLDAAALELNWNELEEKATTLVRFVTSSCSTEEISSIFLGLLRRWIETSSAPQRGIKIELRPQDDTPETPVRDLAEVTVLQKLIDMTPEKLIGHFDQLLELICQVFKADAQSPLGDDILAVVLSLLNLVITAPTFRKSHIKPDELKVVEASLERLSTGERDQVSPTARNLSLLLRYRDEVEDPDESTSAPSSRQIEDRRTYNLAMNYITGGADNPPPVVSEGLNILTGLINAESPVLDIPAITALMSTLLANNDDYINLRVIKVFTSLANKHPKSAVQELLDHYLDAQEKSTTDLRLRFGEALLQVIQRLGDTLTGDIAQDIGETLLSIAGRRGYRAKTMAKQARAEKLQQLKGKKAEAGADDDDMDEDEDITEEKKANNDILAQILQGWESKRGSEDIRIRASALSIFGTAIETNVGGMGPTLVSASVDLCVNILAMEREMETAILRRAAILNILSFVRALSSAKESGRKLGFGLTDGSRSDILTTLRYVAGTDNDGLVQQHADDVVESLENWQVSSMLPDRSPEGGPEMTRLAGLHVNPSGTLVDESGHARPRIEEVE